MAKKSLGYVELEWICPSCGTRNPGSQKTCQSCGMAQPDDVEFQQPAQEKLVEDEARLARAKAGPDIHCHYCGARNPGTATNCSQCGADLSEGAARASGGVLGAHKDKVAEPIECSACGAMNDANAPKCVQCGSPLAEPPPPPPQPKPAAPPPKPKRGLFGIVLTALVVLICAGCITGFILFNRTEDATGTVKDVSWTRIVAIEELVPVTKENWRDEIPVEAVIGLCKEKVHHTETRATGQTREICGTPYTVDTGSGFGEVVQDCRTEDIKDEVSVFEESCEYTVEEWQEVDRAIANGNNLNPNWPAPNITRGQREGERQEKYNVTFSSEQGTYTYTTTDAAEFSQYDVGSKWLIKINTFDIVTEVEPIK